MSTTANYDQLGTSLDTFTSSVKEYGGICCILSLTVNPPYLFLPNSLTRYSENEVLLSPRKFIVDKITKQLNGEWSDEPFIVLHLSETNLPGGDFYNPLLNQYKQINELCKKLYVKTATDLKAIVIDNVDAYNFENVKKVVKFSGTLSTFPQFVASLTKMQLCQFLQEYYIHNG
jgi:hypothetical protein